jgi:hypothetical protein
VPTVAGFVNPIGRTPAFLVPLFREHETSNHLLVQRLSVSDTVAVFEPFDDLRGFEPLEIFHAAPAATVGGEALWAFAFGVGDILLGTADEIRPDLERRLRRGDLNGLPLLETEVAAFCGADDVRDRALTAAYESLGGQSGLGAGVWRDVVVLRPAACSDVFALAKKAGIAFSVADLDAILVESREGFAEIRVPFALLQTLGQPSPDRLSKVSKLAAVFGLKVAVEATWRKPALPLHRLPTSRPVDYPLASFSGPALLGPTMSPSSTSDGYQRVTVGPFGAVNREVRQRAERSWSGRFIVFRNSEAMLNEVLLPIRREFYDGAAIAIVVQRVGFGSPKSSTIPVDRINARLALDDGRSKPRGFVSTFYVGGHVLQRSLGMTPELAASDRGRALALSAASAVMALAYATEAKSARELLPRSRHPPLGLALRHKLRRDETPVDALRALLSKLLHPEVRLAGKGDVSLVISRSLRDAKNALVEDLTASTEIDARVVRVLELPGHGGQRQISLVAMDVPFEPLTPSEFRQFCADLLVAQGWLVETKRTERALPGIVASKHGVTVFFTPLIVLGRAHLAVRDALMNEGFGASTRCIVTNFTPNGLARQAAEAASCPMVHYSRLNEWFEFKVLGRPRPFGRRG